MSTTRRYRPSPVYLLWALTACAETLKPPDRQVRPAASTKGALRVVRDKIRPLHRKLGKPRPGDWLVSHKEAGQTLEQYLSSRPVTPRGKRRVIWIQPLGEFNETERKVIDKTVEFLHLYYNLEVKTKKALPLSEVPAEARRIHPQWGVRQILSTYVLHELLKPRLPADAAAMICFTTSDLWPGRGWNFVFGQASLRERVGVWSIHRNGDPTRGEDAFRLCLLRTVKTASHELGHMFSMRHCTSYECNMCGSNNRAESDRRPLYLCAECLPKLCWATRSDPVARARKLREWCDDHGLTSEAAYQRLLIATLTR